MFRLTREVRFAINGSDDPQLRTPVTNGFGGYPSLVGFGRYMSIEATLSGPLDPVSGYLINIKQIDTAVRERAILFLSRTIGETNAGTPERAVMRLHEMLAAWEPLVLEELKLKLSPFLAYAVCASEPSMIRMSQKFEFSATHRLHNPKVDEAENRRVFGKCNNPHGHGHNYELQVTIHGIPDSNGLLMEVPHLERIVGQTVIDRFDHKNLNVELPEFHELIPTVENIAMTIYRLLKQKFADEQAQLASVTVWETPKTWCEYSE